MLDILRIIISVLIPPIGVFLIILILAEAGLAPCGENADDLYGSPRHLCVPADFTALDRGSQGW